MISATPRVLRISPCARIWIGYAAGARRAAASAAWDFEEIDWRRRLAGKRVLYFGERHEQKAVIDAQRVVLQEWARAGPTALVLEMFTLPQQRFLDAWGTVGFDDLASEYEMAGGDFELSNYAPLLETARELGVRLLAGFPTREAARIVCGTQSDSVELAEMTDMHMALGPVVENHFRLFAGMIAGADLRDLDKSDALPERGRSIFPAQCWKDFVCAKVVLEAAQSYNVMVVVGCGHSDYGLGIPARVAAMADDAFWSGLHQQVPYAIPLPQCIITAREADEVCTRSFRGAALADMVLRYKASSF